MQTNILIISYLGLMNGSLVFHIHRVCYTYLFVSLAVEWLPIFFLPLCSLLKESDLFWWSNSNNKKRKELHFLGSLVARVILSLESGLWGISRNLGDTVWKELLLFWLQWAGLAVMVFAFPSWLFFLIGVHIWDYVSSHFVTMGMNAFL